MSKQTKTTHSAPSALSCLTLYSTCQDPEHRTKYAYDPAGNLLYRTNNTLLQSFTVDSANALTNITRRGTLTVSGNTPAPAASVTVNGDSAAVYADFTFASSNGFALADGPNSFTNIALNYYGTTSVTNVFTANLPAKVALLYDANGNLTNDGYRAFAYDSENRLTNVCVAGQWKSEFLYDGLGRRRITRDYAWQDGAWIKTNEVQDIYDGLIPIQERDSSNVTQVTYTRGPDFSGTLQGAGGIGGLLSRTDSNGSTFYHSDGNGNITALVDPTGYAVARYLCEPFGRLLGKWGPLADVNTMQFSSTPRHPNSGLSFYAFRTYDPTLQRWINHDPSGEQGGSNLYGFVGNNPVGYVDPDGRTLWGGQTVKKGSGEAVLVLNGTPYQIATRTDFIAALRSATEGGKKIHDFTFDGHGDADNGGLIFGGLKATSGDGSNGEMTPSQLEMYLEYFKDLFDPCVRAKFKSCGSANPNVLNSVDVFKKVFPDSVVSGYTGLYLPFVGGVPNWAYFRNGANHPNLPPGSSRWITK